MRPSICFFAIDLYDKGGLQRVTVDLANQLADIFTVHIITFYKPQPSEFPYKFRDNIKLEFLHLPRKRNSVIRVIHSLKIMLTMRRYIRKYNIKTFISVGMASVIWTFLPLLFTTAKYLSWDHTSYMRNDSWAKRGRFLSKLFAHKIIILTKKDAELWRNKKVEVIYNPSSFEFSQSVENFDELNKKDQIIALGRFVEVKGFDRLLDVWKIVNEKKETPFLLKIIGEGPLEEHLKRRILSENIRHVAIESFVPNPEKLYSESKLQVVTSLYEGLSMVLIEGLIFLVPAVSFDVPSGPGEVIEDRKTGFLIKDNDLEAFADSLIELMNNEKLRQEFSNNCVESRKRFANRQIINKWIEIIGVNS